MLENRLEDALGTLVKLVRCCNLYKISHTLKLWDIWIKSSELCKLYQITHPEQTEQIELTERTELTELTDIIVLTENLKKCELLTYSLSDNLKSRDASASKKTEF